MASIDTISTFQLPKLISNRLNSSSPQNPEMVQKNSTPLIARRKKYSLKNVVGQAAVITYNRHLKRYIPANSSSSKLYEDKLLEQNLKAPKKPQQKQSTLYQQPSKPKYPRRAKYHLSTCVSQASQISEIPPHQNTNTKAYEDKLSKIIENGMHLKRKSKQDLRKAYLACRLNQMSYDKIEDNSYDLYGKMEKHTLDEQFSRTYRRNLIDLSFTTKKLARKSTLRRDSSK